MSNDNAPDTGKALAPLPQFQRSRDIFLAPSLLPLQFPSLEHLDEAVEAVRIRMSSVEGLSPQTVRWVGQVYLAFRRYLKAVAAEGVFLSGELPRQLRLLDDWIAWLRTKDSSRPTIANYWRGMRMICSRLTREHGTVNPFIFVRAPHPGQARLECLTQEAAERVLRFVWNDATVCPFIRARNTAVIGVMLLAGLRKAETLGLLVSHVDFDARVVRVAAGKGQHGGKPRTVPMTRQLRSICAAYMEYRETVEVDCDAFFLGNRRRGGLGDMTLRRLFGRISRITGIHVSPHMLRHTFCTLLSKLGVSDRLAREAMGHADLRMLQRYQHVYEGEVADALEAKLRLDFDAGETARGSP